MSRRRTPALVAPQNPDAEDSVLGALLVAGTLGVDTAADTLAKIRETGFEPAHFYRESYTTIYRTIEAIVGRGEACDRIVVAAELDHAGTLESVGGLAKLGELAALASGFANPAHHARLIRQTALERRRFNAAGAIRTAAVNGGVTPEQAEAMRAALEDDHVSYGQTIEPVDLAKLLAGPVPEVAWLWRGWLARGDFALEVGDPGVGKSLLALTLGDSVRQGKVCLGEPCARGRVAIFDYENPLGEAHKRLRSIGVTADEHDGLIYFHAPALNVAKDVAAFADLLQHYEIDLAIVDSLRRAAPGLDENDSAKVSAVLSPLRAMTATTGRAILLVHHSRKRVADNPTDAGQMVRGSGDLVASVDTLLYLRAKEAGTFTLEHGKARRGVPHETIQIRIQSDDDRIELVNEGAVAYADDKLEGMLDRIIRILRTEGAPLERQVLAVRSETDARNGTFSRALNLGWQRDILAKSERVRPTDPQLYGLAEWGEE